MSGTTPVAQDRDLRKALAKKIFHAVSLATDVELPGTVLAAQLLVNRCTDQAMVFRITADHGGKRGAQYHYYRLALTEMSK